MVYVSVGDFMNQITMRDELKAGMHVMNPWAAQFSFKDWSVQQPLVRY